MAQKEWLPNANQRKFLKVVKANPNKTLAELSEIAGFKFTSGCINTLVSHGLIDNSQEVEVVVQTKRKVKTYAFVGEISEIETPEEAE